MSKHYEKIFVNKSYESSLAADSSFTKIKSLLSYTQWVLRNTSQDLIAT